MEENNFRERIIWTLKVHPEGLDLVEISKFTNISRMTIAKYVYWLTGEGLVLQRKVGTAKLCYLKVKK